MTAGDERKTLVYRGTGVLLRYPVESDRDEFIELRRSSRDFLEPWEPIAPEGFDAFGNDSFDRELGGCQTPRREGLLVCRCEDGRIVGRISFQEIIRGPLQQCFLGYWMGARFGGRGHMKEAIGLALGHGFEGLGLHRIEANVQPGNEASRAVVRANGFELEGFSPRYLKIYGTWRDHERWAIHREAWLARMGRTT